MKLIKVAFKNLRSVENRYSICFLPIKVYHQQKTPKTPNYRSYTQVQKSS